MHSGPDRLLSLLKNEYLRRLARFALIDGVPAPWGAGAPKAEPTGDQAEKQDNG